MAVIILSLYATIFPVVLVCYCLPLLSYGPMVTVVDQTIVATSRPQITDQFDLLDHISSYTSAGPMMACAIQLLWGRAYTFELTKAIALTATGIFLKIRDLLTGLVLGGAFTVEYLRDGASRLSTYSHLWCRLIGRILLSTGSGLITTLTRFNEIQHGSATKLCSVLLWAQACNSSIWLHRLSWSGKICRLICH